MQDATELWDLSTTTQTALSFPLVVIGALGLWRVAGLMKLMRGRLGAHVTGQSADTPTATIVLRALLLLERVVPVSRCSRRSSVAIGYLPAANYLIFPTVLTLGLMGAARVFFDLLSKTGAEPARASLGVALRRGRGADPGGRRRAGQRSFAADPRADLGGAHQRPR